MLRVSYILSIFFLFFSFFCPVYFIYILNFDWGLGYLGLRLVVDKVSLVFSGVVILVVSQVYVYRRGYIKGDSSRRIFFFSLSLFITRILLLIFAGDIITLFLAWDGLGVSSFLLVAYYSKIRSIGRGYITIIINRFGDAFIILGIRSFLIERQRRVLFQGCSRVFFILGAFRKRAQFPLIS
jgi:NADH:ubiquinone oxidoreductase subunit 5 (subunit L)/multisubunit Na+/H+ antiporter MnhA subunit